MKKKISLLVILLILFGINLFFGIYVFASQRITLFADKPDRLMVTHQGNQSIITDKHIVEQLYEGLDGFEAITEDTVMSCPAIPGNSQPVEYQLIFYKETKILQEAVFTPPECRATVKSDNKTLYGITNKSIAFQNTLQRALNLSDKDFKGY